MKFDQETIDYLCEWAQSGNEPRHWGRIPSPVLSYCVVGVGEYPASSRRLNTAGLTIAAQAGEIP